MSSGPQERLQIAFAIGTQAEEPLLQVGSFALHDFLTD